MTKGYATLSALEFGSELIRTGDLDPVYNMLYAARPILGEGGLRRWVVGYWLFYHSGVASHLSLFRGPAFWDQVDALLLSRTSCPRGRERRHFRGAKAHSAVAQLRVQAPDPSQLIDGATAGALDFPSIRSRVLSWPQFGPWIAFKAADMLDRVFSVPVFWGGGPELQRHMYEFPRAGAALIAQQQGFRDMGEVIGFLEGALNAEGFRAPPSGNRPVALPEVETVLCKYKSHAAGRYPVGNDIIEVRHHLDAFPSPLSPDMRKCLDESTQLPAIGPEAHPRRPVRNRASPGLG